MSWRLEIGVAIASGAAMVSLIILGTDIFLRPRLIAVFALATAVFTAFEAYQRSAVRRNGFKNMMSKREGLEHLFRKHRPWGYCLLFASCVWNIFFAAMILLSLVQDAAPYDFWTLDRVGILVVAWVFFYFATVFLLPRTIREISQVETVR